MRDYPFTSRSGRILTFGPKVSTSEDVKLQ